MATLPESFLTPEQYLAIEREAETKSEYFAGEMFAMVGATRRHNLIALNIASELRMQFREKTSEAYTSDMRVRVSPHVSPDDRVGRFWSRWRMLRLIARRTGGKSGGRNALRAVVAMGLPDWRPSARTAIPEQIGAKRIVTG